MAHSLVQGIEDGVVFPYKLGYSSQIGYNHAGYIYIYV